MNLQNKMLAGLALFSFFLTTTVAEIADEWIISVDVDSWEITLLHDNWVIINTYLNDKKFSCDQLYLNLKEGTLYSNGERWIIYWQLDVDVTKWIIGINWDITVLDKLYSGHIGIDVKNNSITANNISSDDAENIDTPADLSLYLNKEPYKTLVGIYNSVLNYYNSSNSKFDELQSLVYKYGSDSSEGNLKEILNKNKEALAYYDINGISVLDICLTGWNFSNEKENLWWVILNSWDVKEVNKSVEVVAQKQTPTSVRTWPEHILLLVITFVLCWLFFRYRYRKS